MTALAVELLRILESEAGYPPMTIDSFARVLAALGASPMPTDAEILAALGELMQAGAVEAVHSAKLGCRFRVLQNSPGRDLSAPGPPGEAA